MRKKIYFLLLLSSLFLTACSTAANNEVQIINEIDDKYFKIGILLPDIGLGDHSFNDLAVEGLMKLREDYPVIWEYRDLGTSGSMENALDELLALNLDCIIGVGYMVQELIELKAVELTGQRFALIDTYSEVPNVDGIYFKEDEGSFLAGVVAGLLTETNTIGFLYGMKNDPILEKFYKGFEDGAKSVNKEIIILKEYANTYSDIKVGKNLASKMISEEADILYAAAGYTGIGLLEEAQRQGKYAIGVDSDQYFYAEKAVVTSMIKNVDEAVYQYVEKLLENADQSQLILQFGIEEKGVELAPIRIIPNANEVDKKLKTVSIPKY